MRFEPFVLWGSPMQIESPGCRYVRVPSIEPKALPREMMPSDQTGLYDAIPSKTIMIFSGLTPTSTMFSASISSIRFII